MMKANSVKNRFRKHSLISAIVGVSIAIFTFVCCGLLIPLGLIGAAVFLHQYRIPLIILGIAIAGISVFFMLKGKEVICICNFLDTIKKYKKLAIISTGIIICVSLAIFAVNNFFLPSAKNSASKTNQESTILEWRNKKAEAELVNIVNFLKGDIGKEIELDGKRHLITGKEMLNIKIIMLGCCTKEEFAEMLDNISKIGKVRNSDFSKKEILAELPADEIPKIADIWNVEKISLESDTKILWESIIKGSFVVSNITENVTKVSKYDDFAKCLTDSGVKMYGTYWCTHCNNQKQMLGRSWQYANYIECSLPNRAGQTQVCSQAGIKAYPTWEFQGGKRIEGELTFTQLSQYSGCQLEE